MGKHTQTTTPLYGLEAISKSLRELEGALGKAAHAARNTKSMYQDYLPEAQHLAVVEGYVADLNAMWKESRALTRQGIVVSHKND